MVVFSGVPDPQWQVAISDFNESDFQEIQEGGLYPGCLRARLGYKGFIVRDAGVDLLIGGTDLEFIRLQRVLFELIPVQLIPSELRERVSNEIGNVPLSAHCINRRKRLAPPFGPFLWNNAPNTRRKNNCYNYANIRITNTYAQPGRGGIPIYASLNGADVTAAAVRDGLQVLNPHPGPGDPVPGAPVGPRHLVALFIDTGKSSVGHTQMLSFYDYPYYLEFFMYA